MNLLVECVKFHTVNSSITQMYHSARNPFLSFLQEDYENICRDIHEMNMQTKKQTYKFENLEEMQLFEYRQVIGKAHFFNVRLLY